MKDGKLGTLKKLVKTDHHIVLKLKLTKQIHHGVGIRVMGHKGERLGQMRRNWSEPGGQHRTRHFLT